MNPKYKHKINLLVQSFKTRHGLNEGDIIHLTLLHQVIEERLVRRLRVQNGRCKAKQLEVPGADKSVPTIVTRATANQHIFFLFWTVDLGDGSKGERTRVLH